MSHRRTTAGLAAGAITAALLAPLAGAARAQSDTTADAGLDFVEQTIVVDEDPAVFVVDIADPPDDARLGVTIYDDPLPGRAAVRADHAEPPTNGDRIAAFECTLEGDCFDQALLEVDDDRYRVTLDDDVIGESLRRNPGALTVVLELRDDEGVAVDALVTSLIVLDGTTANRVRVAFLGDLTAPLAHGPDQEIEIDAEPLLDRLLAEPRGVPTTYTLRPETLTALAATDPDALGELVAALEGHSVFRSPWVAMDEEAWRVAAQSDRVVNQYALGNDTIEAVLGAPPSAVARLDPDAGPATLSLLRAAGVAAVIVDDERLPAALTRTDATLPVTVLDDNGVAMTALRVDEALHETLADPDPELAAVRAVIELLMALYDEETPADVATLLDRDRIAPDALIEFLRILDDRREFRVVAVDVLANLDPERVGGTVPRTELAPTNPPDVSGLVADLRAAASAIETLQAMLEPDTEGIDGLSTQLLAAVSSELTQTQARAYADAVFAAVLERTTGIEIPEGDRITLTDRRTDLPLTVVNNQAVALNVDLVLSAEKLRFPEGERRTLRLLPGENDLVIPVETLASGDARVTATIVSPGGAFELASGTVDIRSTAISGLGLAISIVALIVLGVWWIRTILRVRRNRAAATVAAASDEDPAPPTDEPGEGEP